MFQKFYSSGLGWVMRTIEFEYIRLIIGLACLLVRIEDS